jgi:hypothetical protein
MYKLYNLMGELMPILLREDGSIVCICSKECSEYKAYEAWLAEGNEPLPPDSVEGA